MNINPPDNYVTITRGMSGWFAVEVWWNPEGFWEPYDTGVGRYHSPEEAIEEGRTWAESSGIEFIYDSKKGV